MYLYNMHKTAMIDNVTEDMGECIVFLNTPYEKDGHKKIIFANLLTGWTPMTGGGRMILIPEVKDGKHYLHFVSEKYIDNIDNYYSTVYSKCTKQPS